MVFHLFSHGVFSLSFRNIPFLKIFPDITIDLFLRLISWSSDHSLLGGHWRYYQWVPQIKLDYRRSRPIQSYLLTYLLTYSISKHFGPFSKLTKAGSWSCCCTKASPTPTPDQSVPQSCQYTPPRDQHRLVATTRRDAASTI